MRFKAAILTELNKSLVIDEVETQDLDVGQVLVRVMAAGICGAQLGEIAGAKGDDPYLPHLMGHEGGGIVTGTGPGVSHVSLNDHVVMHWRKGRGIEAQFPKYRWNNGTVGGGRVTTFSEYAIVSENRLTKIDKDIPFEISALMGCAVTTAFGLISNEAKVKIGESIVIAGVGGVGLNVVQGAFMAGANPIIGIDRSQSARHRALAIGADAAIGNENAYDKIQKSLENRGCDVFVDCTGDCDMIARGYELIKPGGGRMIMVGQPHHDRCLSIPDFRNHYCGKTVMDSQGGLTVPQEDIPRYLGLYRAGKLNLDNLITHRFPLENVNEAIDVMRSGEAGRCILTMD